MKKVAHPADVHHYFSRPTWAQGHAMTKTKTDRRSTPVDQTIDSEVVAFRQQFDERSPLDQLVQEGARKMLQEAIDAEVDAFVDQHRDRRDERGRRLVVKNGSLPARQILTGAGAIEVEQGRVRDNSPNPDDRVRFTPSLLPAYLRRTDAIEELIPWLYLQRNFYERVWRSSASSRWTNKTKGLSPNVIVRLKEQVGRRVRILEQTRLVG